MSQVVSKNLFIVEGLPGVGKSFFCEALQQELRDSSGTEKIHFFEERDWDHPFHISPDDVTNGIWSVDYREFIGAVEKKCHNFFADTYAADDIYIFDCALLQRPIYYSMIIGDLSEEATFSHVRRLYGNLENLPYQVFYLESREFLRDFEFIYRDRGPEYRDFIERTWTNSKFGTEHELQGLEGAMEVLKYFKELKERFLFRLNLSPVIIDNTAKKPDVVRNRIREALKVRFEESADHDGT
jgi:hypothetical protein